MDASPSHVKGGASTNNAIPCTLIAKWGKEKIVLEKLTVRDTIATVKDRLTEKTGVLQKRQKLIGLTAVNGGSKAISDSTVLGDLKVKPTKKNASSSSPNGVPAGDDGALGVVHEFILMGTPEEDIFVDPSEKDDLPDVIDDFDLDFNVSPGAKEFLCDFFSSISFSSFSILAMFDRWAVVSGSITSLMERISKSLRSTRRYTLSILPEQTNLC
jgi:hypothetical protein